jgi:hypothetical protein
MSLRPKKILRSAIAVCLCALALEVLTRAYFSAKLGAVVLLYGIVDSPHDALFDPKGAVMRWDEKYANTAIHDNAFDNYSKYFPNQKRIHPDESGKTIDATINSSGFRGKDFQQKKTPGVVRIVTLGASSTFGFKTRDDQTYPHFLEEALNKSLPMPNPAGSSNGTIIKYEVINLGIPHMQSDQIHSLFMAEAVPLEPDVVTFYEGYTDAAGGPRDDAAVQRVKRIPFATPVFRELRHRLLSVALISKKLFSRRYAPLDATESGFQGEAQAKQEKFIKELQAIYQECRTRNILFIVANQQAKSLNVDREKIQGVSYAQEAALVREKLFAAGGVLALGKYFLIHNSLMDAERQWAKTNGVPFADVIGAMDPNRQCLIDWMHLNAQGNQIVAAALAEKIINRQ